MNMLECRTCLKRGDVLVGWTSGTWMSPPEPITDECPVCWGFGELPEDEFEARWGGVWPSEEEAGEIARDRRAPDDGTVELRDR